MAESRADATKHGVLAMRADVTDVLGQLDNGKIVAIMALKPTIKDVEDASMWLAGDSDVFGPGSPVKGVAAEIVALLTTDEEEDASRAR